MTKTRKGRTDEKPRHQQQPPEKDVFLFASFTVIFSSPQVTFFFLSRSLVVQVHLTGYFEPEPDEDDLDSEEDEELESDAELDVEDQAHPRKHVPSVRLQNTTACKLLKKARAYTSSFSCHRCMCRY